jgi:hypothetical protein
MPKVARSQPRTAAFSRSSPAPRTRSKGVTRSALPWKVTMHTRSPSWRSPRACRTADCTRVSLEEKPMEPDTSRTSTTSTTVGGCVRWCGGGGGRKEEGVRGPDSVRGAATDNDSPGDANHCAVLLVPVLSTGGGFVRMCAWGVGWGWSHASGVHTCPARCSAVPTLARSSWGSAVPPGVVGRADTASTVTNTTSVLVTPAARTPALGAALSSKPPWDPRSPTAAAPPTALLGKPGAGMAPTGSPLAPGPGPAPAPAPAPVAAQPAASEVTGTTPVLAAPTPAGAG